MQYEELVARVAEAKIAAGNNIIELGNFDNLLYSIGYYIYTLPMQ